MRLLLIVALLIGFVIAPMAVYAEENGAAVNETGMVAGEETTSMETSPADLALLFGKVHSTLLMSTEEAFGYLLMNDTAEKQAFYDEVTASKEAFLAFEAVAAKAGESESVLVSADEQAQDAFTNMTMAADAMFASFEKEGAPVQKDVIAFEDSVDAVFNITDKAWADRNSGNASVMTADSSVRALYGQLLGAVQESYAYPVVGDKGEKEDALARFAEFDTRVANYTVKYPDVSYDSLKAEKEEIQKAAETMFATYEKDGKVNEEEAAALEALVEKMNLESMKQYNQPSSDIVPVTEELSAGNETAVNTTA